jgi:hypothetical protein
MPRLTIIGPEGRQEFDLLPHNTLGRHPNNTMQVLDRIVSKEHAHIDLVDGRYMLRDLGSLNGTYVNGERVGERVLNPGDELTMGSTKIIFDAEGAAARSRPSGGSNPSVPTVGMGVPPSPGHYSPSMPQAPAWQQPVAPAPSFPTSPLGGAPAPSFQTSPLSAEALAGAGLVGGSVAANLSQSIAKAAKPISNVTIAPGMVESHIRTRLGMEQNFLPEKLVADHDALRRDYEKLRVSYELARQIGNELDIQKVLDRILAAAFQLLAADRGIILLADESGEQLPRALRTRSGQVNASEPVQISKTLVDQVRSTKEAVLSSDAMVDNRFKGAHSMIMQGIRSSMAVPLLHSGALLGVMMVDSQNPNAFGEKDLQLFTEHREPGSALHRQRALARKLEQEALARARFQRLLSPAIAELVVSGQGGVEAGRRAARHHHALLGHPRLHLALGDDARGGHRLHAQRVLRAHGRDRLPLRGHARQVRGRRDHGALRGAGVGQVTTPCALVRTALDMLDELRPLQPLREHGRCPSDIGIGINTGDLVAGYIGSKHAVSTRSSAHTVNTRLAAVWTRPGRRDPANAEDAAPTRLQLERFEEVLHFYERRSLPRPLAHAASSGAILGSPASYLDMVRPGVLFYGVSPGIDVPLSIDVRPALRWSTQVVYFKVVPPGHPVSYGSTWAPTGNVRVVTLPVGYGDGYPRAMSGRAEVLMHGKRYPVVGRICMDQLMVSIGWDSAYNGDPVTLIGQDGSGQVRVEDLARWAGTIPHEILACINTRVPRVYVGPSPSEAPPRGA